MTDELFAANQIKRWRDDPSLFVRELFGVEPDPWQDEALRAFPSTPRLAMKACAGPGKTAVLAWLGWNFMLTRLKPIIGATSISGDNLKAGLWTELSRWYDVSPLLKSQFEMTKTTVFQKDNPGTWKIEARTWAKDADALQIGNALAGIHAPYVMWLLDESGDYPEAIMPTCESIFAGTTEAHIVQAGNPTRLSGPLYRACATARDLWKVIEITGDPDDPRRSSRIPVDYAREQIKQYGRENPWVMIRIFGKFPPHSLNALVGPDDISAAVNRFYREYEYGHAPKILAADVARFGDDSSVIAKRQGQVMFPMLQYRNVDSTHGAGIVAREWQAFDADACFIDDTGGYGAGWIDALRQLGRTPIGVPFAGQATDRRYANKRAEMYFTFAQWIKDGGALPDHPELGAALTQTTYTFKGDAMILEPKEVIKSKMNGVSPDHADAGALTFAHPVSPKNQARSSVRPRHTYDYDPFAEMHGVSDYVRGIR